MEECGISVVMQIGRIDHRSLYSGERSQDQGHKVKGHKVKDNGQMSKGQMSSLLGEMMLNDYNRFPYLSYFFTVIYSSYYCRVTGIKHEFFGF